MDYGLANKSKRVALLRQTFVGDTECGGELHCCSGVVADTPHVTDVAHLRCRVENSAAVRSCCGLGSSLAGERAVLSFGLVAGLD